MVNTVQRSYEMHLRDTLGYQGPIYLGNIDATRIRGLLDQKAGARRLCSGIAEPSARILAEALGLDTSLLDVTDIQNTLGRDLNNIERILKGEQVPERPLDTLCCTAQYLLRIISKYERKNVTST